MAIRAGLMDKARRKVEMVLDREVDTKTKLFGECYESVCGNDAGWVYFVN